MNTNDIPIWQKYTLSIEEASRYFRIGEKKLRRLAEENPDANWLIMNGNRLQIKRKQFEKVRRAGGYLTKPADNGPRARYNMYSVSRLIPAMEGSFTSCQRKDAIAKVEF